MTTTFECPVCAKTTSDNDRRHWHLIPASARRFLHLRRPELDVGDDVCRTCVDDAHLEDMTAMLAADGELTDDETEVLDSIRRNEILTAEEDFEAEDREERAVNNIARAIGSWSVFGAILLFLVVWFAVNLATKPFEPYPVIVFAVTSAFLASLAALEGPLIIMSQRSQRIRDRERSRADYKVNLKAELEIRYLDEKVDLLLASNHALRRDLAALRSALGADEEA